MIPAKLLPTRILRNSNSKEEGRSPSIEKCDARGEIKVHILRKPQPLMSFLTEGKGTGGIKRSEIKAEEESELAEGNWGK